MKALQAPSDADLVAVFEGLRREESGAGRSPPRVMRMERCPYPYATSCTIEELRAEFDDGVGLELLVKHLGRARLLVEARNVKPLWLHEPMRDLETYRSIIGPAAIGPRCYATGVDPARAEYWIVLEKVPGTPLWQIGDPSTWSGVARWLARFHRLFEDRTEQVCAANPYLLTCDREYFHRWARHAVHAVAHHHVITGDDRTPEAHRLLAQIAERYSAVVDRLCSLPAVFVHGELFASNVVVDGSGANVRVWPVDWEMAAVGPALLDVAALTSGWDPAARAVLVGAYLDELGTRWGFTLPELHDVLSSCRLHYALQWLGWSPTWMPPAEHRRDWLAEAVSLAVELRLIDGKAD